MDSYQRLEWGQSRRGSDEYKRPRSPDGNLYRDRGHRVRRDRSRSPVHIDRYAPGRDRDRHDDRDRGRDRDYDRESRDLDRRRRTPPPAQAGIDRYVPKHDQQQQNVIMFNPIQDPMKLGFQAGFTYFAEWWRHEKMVKENRERQKNGGRGRPVRGEKESIEDRAKERELIQADYDDYKKKLQSEMARRFVDEHKNDEWFKERYEPETRAPFKAEINDVRRGFYDKWASDLNSGTFDEFTLEGIYKSESNGAGGVVEKEEGEAAAANEVLGVGDLLPTRGGDLRDETIMQPTLLIKTIAPFVSRSKMEAFCKEHLGEGGGGFKWLSLSDPNPQKKFHRIGWVLLNDAAEDEQMMDNDRSDPRDGRQEDGEEVDFKDAMDAEPATKLSVSTKGLENLNGKTVHDEVRGDFTCHVGIHEPPIMPRKKALWDLFSAPERIDRDLQLATRLAQKLDAELGEGYDSVSKIEERVEELRQQGQLQPTISTTSLKKAKLEDDEDMDDEDEGALDEDDEGAIDEENDDEELLCKKKRLDFLVEYLRRVYHFCLFCVFESDSIHELTRKCPGGHLRRPRASLTTSAKAVARASARGENFPYKKNEISGEGDEDASPEQAKRPKGFSKTQQQLERAYKWVKTYEEKLLQILDPESIDITKLGGKPAEDALEDALSKFVSQEDESKFRCKVPDCTKLFKGQNFWRKHVEKRHEEFYAKIKHDVSLINAYVLDPAHIAPSRSDATSNGHFPIKHDSGMTGTPRGFNFNAHAANAMGLPPYIATGAPGGQNFMPMGAMMGGMFNGGMIPGAGGVFPMGAAGGPIRSQDRRQPNSNRPPGPYDRGTNGTANRNARWASNNGANPQSGRLSPPRSGMPVMGFPGGQAPMMGAAAGLQRARGPPAFGEGGAGPLEATNGRQLRSYQDLDATAENDNTGELDY